MREQTKDLRKQLKIVKEAEKKQEQLLNEINSQKEFVQTLLNSQEQIIITTDGKILKSCNRTFLDFFEVTTMEEFQKDYNCICDRFDTKAPKDYLQIEIDGQKWIDYVISHSDKIHKAMITIENSSFIFSVTATNLPDTELKCAVFTDITEMERAKQEIELMHRKTRESIEYASLIQGSLIPDHQIFRKYFKDYFAIWHPKDIVGGDIYLFEELRDENECLLMVIDCTGHGVPGAFVTMLVKAIERQITSTILNSDEVVSPSKILTIFNRTMKQLLQQDDEDSISNAGFDGQVLYYNKKDKIVKFASARNELFYVQDSRLHVIKGDRHSIGYKDSDSNYKFTEHEIDVSKETQMYISSDGYWDQMGGERERSFGKKRFKALIEEIESESMADQQEEFIYTLYDYQGDMDRQDDVTVIGIKI